MQEKTRKKLLVGLLAGTVGFSALRPDQMITKPLQKQSEDWDQAQKAFIEASDKEVEMVKAQAKLKEWKYQSLPPNTVNAQRVYRTWINDLAEECGLSRLIVEGGGGGSRKATRMGDVYKSVKVKLEGEGTLAELSRFLYRFKRADLLQRIRDLNIQSEDVDGDPYMTISMIAEGVCMASADTRTDLFLQSSLSQELDEEATALAVANTESFPTQPGFQVKVGSEYMEVTGVAEDGTWTVERGQDDSEPQAHPADAKVQYVPVAEAMADMSFEKYKDFLAASPFVIPAKERTYEPKINTIAAKDLVRGDKLSLKVTTSEFNPAVGAPVFSLAEGHPEGMAIDKQTGEVTWEPGDEIELKEYPAEVLVTQANNGDVQLKKDFKVTVIVKNSAPTVEVPRGQIAAWLGQTVTVDLTIKDDDTANNRMKFTIEGVEGAYIDSKTQSFNWRPAEDIDPGEYEAKLTCEDAGGKTAEVTLRFIARDDAARYTKFTGVVGRNNVMEASLFDQINNKQTKLLVGNKVDVANISGTIKAIGDRSLILTTYDGDMQVELGDDLRTVAEAFAEELKRNPPPAKELEEAPAAEAGKDATAGAPDEEAAVDAADAPDQKADTATPTEPADKTADEDAENPKKETEEPAEDAKVG